MSEHYSPLINSKIDEAFHKRNVWSWWQIACIFPAMFIATVNLWMHSGVLRVLWLVPTAAWAFCYWRYWVWVHRTRRLMDERQKQLDEHNEFIRKRFFN